MAGLANKFFKFIGVEDQEMEEYYEANDSLEETPKKVVDFPTNGRAARRGNNDDMSSMSSMSSASQLKMVVYHPISYEDTQNIIDNVKSRKPVIVNMEDLDVECAQRILDFMAGAVYALRGTIYKISRGIFAIAPETYDIIGSGQEDADEEVF